MNSTPPNAGEGKGTAIFSPVLAGLLTSQVIATGFVYASNHHLLTLVRAVTKAGYFPIPTGSVTATLSRFGPAFWGGLFFTLSIGVGLTLSTWAGLQLWDLLFHRNRKVSVACLFIYAGLLTGVNVNGFALFPSLFCLLVPLVTAWVSLKGIAGRHREHSALWVVPVITLVSLTVLWSTQLNQDLFTSIRDNILLSNPVGRRVNDFYYRYTLYAAEAFKSFRQKTLRSCHLEGIDGPRSIRQWEDRLARYDVLVLPDLKSPDLRLRFTGNGLELISPSGRSRHTTPRTFMADPGSNLNAFSRASDRFAPLRRITFVGLLLGFPVLMFVSVYGIFRFVAGLMMSVNRAMLASSALCMVIGVLLFLPMLKARPVAVSPDNIEAALASDDWSHCVAALRYIESHNLEITLYPSYRRLLHSPLMIERYWLARALGKSRSGTTYQQLLALLDDPQPNILCQTFFALGERGRKTAIEPIKQRIETTDNWYAQWYGYGALRKLGWRQTKSD